MTQLQRYAEMMKVNLTKARARIALHVGAEGSVLAQTIQARADKIVVHFDLESPDEPSRIAGLVRNARNGCFVRQTIGRPDLFEDTLTLNGNPFKPDDYPAPSRR